MLFPESDRIAFHSCNFSVTMIISSSREVFKRFLWVNGLLTTYLPPNDHKEEICRYDLFKLPTPLQPMSYFYWSIELKGKFSV